MPERKAIESMFDQLAGRYDILNNILSFRIHWIWKKALVEEVLKLKPAKVIDVATGTGDIPELINQHSPSTFVTGTDISDGMLDVARRRNPDFNFVRDDITNSSIEDDSYEVSIISFGIRNVSSLELALKELKRITTSEIFILEFGQPRNFILKKLYFMLMNKFIPFCGSLFSLQDSYKYLVSSSSVFPSDQKFVDLIKGYGFEDVHYDTFSFGICYLYRIKL